MVLSNRGVVGVELAGGGKENGERSVKRVWRRGAERSHAGFDGVGGTSPEAIPLMGLTKMMQPNRTREYCVDVEQIPPDGRNNK